MIRFPYPLDINKIATAIAVAVAAGQVMGNLANKVVNQFFSKSDDGKMNTTQGSNDNNKKY